MLDMSQYFSERECFFNMSFEKIATQHPGKYLPLEEALRNVTEYRGGSANVKWEKLDGLFSGALNDVIFSLFKIKTSVTFRPITIAATTTIRANQRHILSREDLRAWLTNENVNDRELLAWQKELASSVGWVDLDTAVVGGSYRKMNHKLYIDINTLKNKLRLSIRQITAIVLHEIGHCFTYFEHQTRLVSTNHVLSDIHAMGYSTAKGNKRKAIFLKANGKKLLTDDQIKDLDKKDNDTILDYTLSKDILENMTSELPHVKYDGTSGEQVADSFAARCGYGKEIVIALARLTEEYGINPGITIAVNIMVMTSLTAMIAAVALGIATLPALALFYTAGLVLIIIGAIIGNNSSNRINTYDNDKNRFRRVKENLIDMLKDLKLDKEYQSGLLMSIDQIQQYEDLASTNPEFYNIIGNWFSSAGRAVKRDIEFQQQLERLANNNLFVAAAKLA